VTRTSFAGSTCPVARSVDVVADPWALLIVRDAFDGLARFGEFQRSLGVARNVLAGRLRALVDAGILEAAPASDGTAYHEYALTAKGRDLFPVIVALRQWGEAYEFAPGEPRSVLEERRTGQGLARMRPRTQDGRPLAPEDALVRRPVA
jgi:DNA-binding HxlR family transcriptional regulator